MTTKDANYYLARAQEIRRRGGSEELARQMENYATNLTAGIYNDTTPVWRPTAPAAGTSAPKKRSNTKQSAGGSNAASYQAPPVQHVISPNVEQIPSVLPPQGWYDAGRPQDDVPVVQTGGIPQITPDYNVGRPEDDVPVVQRQGIGTNRRGDFRQGLPAAVASLHESTKSSTPRESINFGDTWRQAYTNTPVGDTREQDWQNAKNSIFNKTQGFYRDILGRYLNPNTDGILPQRGSYMNISAPSENNVADFKRLNDTNNIPIVDFGTSPVGMVAEAERPKQYTSKPSGSTDLTHFYAQQLGGAGYELNEGKDGIHYGDSGLVNRMRDLRGIIPYNESDGTNCARTVSVALDGTPYSGMYNVDQMVNKAKNNGQLIDPASGYVPQPGDLAVTNGGDHIVMVTENGGVIQNGKSHNGVYETDKPPTEQKGGVQYYIRTSDYNNAFPSFHANLGLGEWDFNEPFAMK